MFVLIRKRFLHEFNLFSSFFSFCHLTFSNLCLLFLFCFCFPPFTIIAVQGLSLITCVAFVHLLKVLSFHEVSLCFAEFCSPLYHHPSPMILSDSLICFPACIASHAWYVQSVHCIILLSTWMYVYIFHRNVCVHSKMCYEHFYLNTLMTEKKKLSLEKFLGKKKCK